VQTRTWHLCRRGPRKHDTRSQARGICQHKQAGKRTNEGKVRAGRCRVRAHRKDMQCKHPGKAPDVLLSLSLGITSHQRNATHDNGGPWPRRAPVLRAPGCRSCRLVPSWSNYACESGQGWPERAHPNEQPGVLRQCHVARLYGAAHASLGCASALGHSWRRPFLRIFGMDPQPSWFVIYLECVALFY
jgi:hypothetical protein